MIAGLEEAKNLAGESLRLIQIRLATPSLEKSRLLVKHNRPKREPPMRCHSARLWYAEPNAVANAIGYAKHRSRSHDAVIRVYDQAGNVIETHEHAGDFKER